jgi:hypothetical protein
MKVFVNHDSEITYNITIDAQQAVVMDAALRLYYEFFAIEEEDVCAARCMAKTLRKSLVEDLDVEELHDDTLDLEFE